MSIHRVPSDTDISVLLLSDRLELLKHIFFERPPCCNLGEGQAAMDPPSYCRSKHAGWPNMTSFDYIGRKYLSKIFHSLNRLKASAKLKANSSHCSLFFAIATPTKIESKLLLKFV